MGMEPRVRKLRFLFGKRNEHTPRKYGKGPPTRIVPRQEWIEDAMRSFEERIRRFRKRA